MKPLTSVSLGSVVSVDRDQRQWKRRRYVGLEDIESHSGRLLGDGSVETVKSTTFGFDERHVLYGRLRPYLNKVLLPDFAGHCSTEIFPLLPNAKLDRRYLWYWLTNGSTVTAIDATCTGARMPRANMDRALELGIPLPPIDEQRRIVAVLDEAFAAIATATANAEKNLANARELFEQSSAKLLSEGGSDRQERLLGDICTISSKLVDPRLDEYIDLPHVGGGNIGSRTGRLSDVLTARQEGLISGKFVFDPTMVLYSKIRPYLMKACRPDFAGLCSADVYPLTPKDGELDREFLFHILLSRDFTAYAEEGSARAGMPKVNRDHLFAYRLRLPPIEAQRELAAHIDALGEECRVFAGCFRRKLQQLEALKQSLLHRAFTGKLTARELEPA